MDLVSSQLHPIYIEDFKQLEKSIDINSLRGTRWLVTGATGFVPAYLVRFLAWLDEQHSLGVELHLWVRSEAKARSLFPWVNLGDERRAIHVPDWQHPEAWTRPPCDYIVHAASPATPAACQADPDGVVRCNVNATQALLRGLKKEDLRAFLFFSSSEVYGETGDTLSPDESANGRLDPCSPRSLYPLAKLLGESICLNAFHSGTLPVRIARIFHTYGPGMDLQHDGRVFADFIGNVIRGEDIILKSDGAGRRAFCYLSDTTAALLKILSLGRDGGCYNVGNPNGVASMSGLADLLLGLVPEKHLKKVVLGQASPQSASHAVFPNIDRLRALGWTPSIAPKDGFMRTIKSYTA